jgi:hypothetical protein
MDIEANLREYIEGDDNSQGIGPLERYASFDYCFNYFQSFREQDRLYELINPKYLEQSCLQLGFYLASWGMLRASSPLLGKSVKIYEPVIAAVARADPALWTIDAHCYTAANIELLRDFERDLFFKLDSPTETLTTKIMLGVFGSVPAFDSRFVKGFPGVRRFCKPALEKIAQFYNDHQAIIDKNRLSTIDFNTGKRTHRQYTRAKVIDMIFFIEGGK